MGNVISLHDNKVRDELPDRGDYYQLLGAHVYDIAVEAGWNEASGENALTYLLRNTYRWGLQEGREHAAPQLEYPGYE